MVISVLIHLCMTVQSHSVISMCHISEKTGLLSILPEISISCRCVVLVRRWSFFTPVSPRTNPDEFPHLISTGSKISGSAAEPSPLAVLYSMFWVCSDLTHQFVWFVALWSSEPQHRRAFWKPGHGDDTAAGGATRVSTGTTELGAFGEAEGGEERFEESNMPRHMKGLVDHSLWGDWMQRRRPLAGHNKDGLDCEREPQAGVRWSGSYTCTELIFTHLLALFNQQPSGERY